MQLDVLGLRECDLAKIPATMSRTSFRIVQEALTNARKHAPGEPCRCGSRVSPGEVLEVACATRWASRSGRRAPAGVGLTGMTERAELAGGALTYGGQPDGSFLVRARLPWSL